MKGCIISIFVCFLCFLQGCNLSGSRSDEFFHDEVSTYDRIAIDFQVAGDNDTTLLFIHGWNLNKTYWENQVKHLHTGYKVVTIDLAGHGNSARNRKNWTVEGFAQDIVNIIEKNKFSNIILIGHSMGGEIALQVYHQIPQEIIGIVGVENFKDVDFAITPEFTNDFKDRFNKFKRNYVKMSDDYARENIRSTNRDVINRIVNDYKSADPKIALAIFKNLVRKYEQDKYHLMNLPFPLYVIASDYAPYNEDGLKKYARQGYEILWIQQSGHFPMIEQPQQFQEALDTILIKIANRQVIQPEP